MSLEHEKPAWHALCADFRSTRSVGLDLVRNVHGFLGLCAGSYGAPARTRTWDARFRKPTLYPLSYGGVGATLSNFGRRA